MSERMARRSWLGGVLAGLWALVWGKATASPSVSAAWPESEPNELPPPPSGFVRWHIRNHWGSWGKNEPR